MTTTVSLKVSRYPFMAQEFKLSWDDVLPPRIEDPTIEQMFRLYYSYARIHCKTHKEIAARFRRYFSPLACMKASEITPAHVQKWHSVMGERFGRPTANHALRLLRTMFNHCARSGLYRGENPASLVRQFREKSRERFITANEMPKFFAALSELSPRTRDFFYLLLFTGARSSNVLSMKWKDVNTSESTWTIDNSKNGEPVVLPLDSRAMAALARLSRADSAVYVFPAQKRGSYMAFPRREWGRLRQQFPGLNAHDLRRTLATWEINTGASLEVVGKSLGHKSSESTRVYAKLQIAPVRRALDVAISAMVSSADYRDLRPE